MRIFLVAMCLVAIAMMACEPSTTATKSAPSTLPRATKEPSPALLLSEDSAISILQAFLQECVLSWDVEYESSFSGRAMQRGAPVPSEQEKKWWMGLARGEIGEAVYSAQYHGVTELPYPYSSLSSAVETWVVIGPGFDRPGGDLETVPGRWKVYAGHRIAYPLDAPARLALGEYKKPLDAHFDPDCRGYSEQ